MATFSVVGTPIGNLDDITLRALKVLANADLVLSEDTRVARRLFLRHALKTPMLSYHAHSSRARTSQIIDLLKQGKNLALVSDAGTPGIADPGAKLVSHIRDALSEEISSGDLKIEAIPGPSALTAALSVAGIASADFTFLGFLPHKKGRQTLFKEMADSSRTVVFYESPHRIMKTLDSLQGIKKVTVCRELTKVFEEVVSGTAAEVRQYFAAHADKIKGEFVVIVRDQ
ncbi:MAG: rRNA (cytidine1402-2-O)-methyltransferase [Candidatus Parcubacteria bacterium]|jgi:16S rRNA (cytidine1402-2'-O)-methyltransferase|nr:rRNA (cytidine1402-2-O)-methyltransferase [Candidatus Parcubacteria bacterium]